MTTTNWLLINTTTIILLYCMMNVEASEVKLSGGIIVEAKLDNISTKAETTITTYFQERGYRTSYELVRDGDIQRVQTSFKNYYHPTNVDKACFTLLELLTKDYITFYEARRFMYDFIFKVEAAKTEGQVYKSIWSVDFQSPKDKVNATSLRLPVTKFVVLLHYYKDCSEAKELCDQLGA